MSNPKSTFTESHREHPTGLSGEEEEEEEGGEEGGGGSGLTDSFLTARRGRRRRCLGDPPAEPVPRPTRPGATAAVGLLRPVVPAVCLQGHYGEEKKI